MKVKTGIDIAKISRIDKVLKRSDTTFLKNHFHESEIEGKKIQSIAGLWAAKESIIKALNLAPDSWLKIQLFHMDSGKPTFRINDQNIEKTIISRDISISHEDDYALASTVLFLSE